MIRYLDYNDGYTSKESGHPRDSITSVLPVTEVTRQGGRRASVAVYEGFCPTGDAATLKYLGFAHVTNGCIVSILSAAKS